MLVLGWTQIFQTLISVLPEMDFTKIAKYSLFYWRFWQFWAIFGKTHEVSLLRHPDVWSYIQKWTLIWNLIKIPTQIQLCCSRFEPITRTTSNPTFNKGQNGGQKGQKQKWWIDPLGTMWWCKRLLDLVFLTNFKFSSLLFTGFWDFL